jgi:hypothetical protein
LYKTHLLTNQFTPINQFDKENNSAKKISVELYEPFTLESWGILSQLGFICIVSIFLTIFQNEYKEEVLIILKHFGFKNPRDERKLPNYVILNIVLMILLEVNIFLPKLAEVISY